MKQTLLKRLWLAFLAAMLCLPMSAQVEELIHKKISIAYDAATEIIPGEWYIMQNCGQGKSGYQHSNGVGKPITYGKTMDIQDDMLADEVAASLLRFIEAEEEGTFYIQTGLGDYFGVMVTGNNEGTVADPIYPFTLNYIEGQYDYFWLQEVKGNGLIVDCNNTSSSTMAGWGKTPPTSPTSNAAWQFFHIDLESLSNYEYLLSQLNRLLLLYEEYLYEEKVFDVGQSYGQYDAEEEVAEFLEKMARVEEIMYREDGTEEEMQKLIEEIPALYQTIINSRIPLLYPVQDGYYRLRTGMKYSVTKDVVVGQDENGDDITETVNEPVEKGMYGTLDGFGKWGTLDRTDARFVWKLTNVEGGVDMQNAATDMRFKELTDSTVTMSLESEKLMAFDYAGTDDEDEEAIRLYIRPATSNEGSNDYLHQMNHGQGKGSGNTMVTWAATYKMTNGDKGTSEWILEPVTEEEAMKLIDDFAPIKNHDLLVARYRELTAEAKALVGKADDAVRMGDKMVNSVSQLSSPWSDPGEGKLADMLDGNRSTFWHSNWRNGDVAPHSHFFQVDLLEPKEGSFVMYLMRRNNDNDHPILFSLYGSNDEYSLDDEFEDSWELIADNIRMPYSSSEPEVYSDLITLETPYQYLRFYIDGTNGIGGKDRGYAHTAEFQLYQADIVETSQLMAMGETGQKLVDEISFAEAVNMNDLTIDEYNALKDAYEAFQARFVDPTPLRSAIKANQNATDVVVIGTDPGFWSEESAAGQFVQLLQEASAYDRASQYTQEQTDAYVKQIQEAVKGILESANQVSTDRWYRFHFASEETYLAHEWSPSNVESNTSGFLYDQYVSVTEGDAPNLMEKEPENVREGNAMFFLNRDELVDDGLCLFRFVNVADTAYAIQNKVTGLYIHAAAANNNDVTLSLHPTLFTVRAIGYGENLMNGVNLDGKNVTNLHAQLWNHRLVTWYAEEPGTNSGLYIEDAGPIEDYEGGLFYREVLPGKLTAECWPTAVTSEELAFYNVAGHFTQDEQLYVALSKSEKTEPGVPYIAMYGSAEDYTGITSDSVIVSLQAGLAIEREAAKSNGLIGTYSSMDAPKGAIVFEGNTAFAAIGVEETEEGEEGATTREGEEEEQPQPTVIKAHSAYLMLDGPALEEGSSYDLAIAVEDYDPTSIQNVMQQLSQRGNIYTADGKLVKANATLNDMKGQARGLYILNGVKVLVK